MNTESHEYVIEVEGLKKHFPLREGLFGQQTGQLRAVDGVSFRIRQGTIFGLVGESGSGKTTVGRTLLGLYEKSAGSVKYRGRELSALSSQEMQALREEVASLKFALAELQKAVNAMDPEGQFEMTSVNDPAKKPGR